VPDPQVVIIGAGPAGLTAAYELDKNGVGSTVLEKDPVYVGGIARTAQYKGYRFDIGGHRFFSKSQEIEALWTEILGDEMLVRDRLSRIYYRGKFFDYPLKATNALFNLGLVETFRCMMSYAWARVRPVRNPTSFEDWVSNQFGYRLYSIFFKTYTEKVWGISTRELSADWAAQRIKGLNMWAVIRTTLLPRRARVKARGDEMIKTLIDEFRYPRLGPGQMWDRVTEILRGHGRQVRLGENVVAIKRGEAGVTAVITEGSAGKQLYSGTHYISTMPIRELVDKCEPELPDEVVAASRALRYRDFLSVALLVRRSDLFPDNWIYIHEPNFKLGRIQNFKNWSPGMVPDEDTTCVGLEYFCFEGDGLWNSPDEDLVALGTRELAGLGLCREAEVFDGVVVRQAKAYPVYDDAYLRNVAVVRDYLNAHLPNLALVGRNGMHHYNNQDHSMMTALLVARNIATGTTFDPWKVNTDAEYHEEARVGEADHTGRLVPSRAKE
jgi:protoporphyrinogen oxidase